MPSSGTSGLVGRGIGKVPSSGFSESSGVVVGCVGSTEGFCGSAFSEGSSGADVGSVGADSLVLGAVVLGAVVMVLDSGEAVCLPQAHSSSILRTRTKMIE